MKNILYVIGAACVVSAAACGGGDAKSPDGSGAKTLVGRPIDKAKADAIKKGEDNKASIEKTFGAPFKTEKLAKAPPECSDMAMYMHGTRMGEEKKLHVVTLAVVFDPSGVVCETVQGATDEKLP